MHTHPLILVLLISGIGSHNACAGVHCDNSLPRSPSSALKWADVDHLTWLLGTIPTSTPERSYGMPFGPDPRLPISDCDSSAAVRPASESPNSLALLLSALAS